MTAANPAGQPTGHNLTFEDVLPVGISCAPGSSQIGEQDIEPQVTNDAPTA
jgi:hypothetical protein